jgi:hypothetical protein
MSKAVTIGKTIITKVTEVVPIRFITLLMDREEK